ncbi:MAG: site-specific integrase [Oscillospiraceae bacterium]|nr:site-specific integrase [Oscillospiraceae bacterium]
MPKAQRPEMSWIESRQQWRKRITLDGKSMDVYGKTKTEVRERVQEIHRQHRAGMVLDSYMTLVQYAGEWFPVKTANLAPKSAEVYANAINNHICPFFGSIRLRDIRPLNVQQFMAAKSPLSNSSQSKLLFTLSQIMQSAEDNGLILKNPCRGIKAGGAPSQPKTPLTSLQQAQLVKAVRGTRAGLFVLLCLYAGLRREEALGLLWENVHLDGVPYLNVRHTVTFNQSGLPIHSTKLKTKAAYRTVAIPHPLADALRNAHTGAASPFVIPAIGSSGAMSLSAFRRMWDVAVKTVPFHIEPHVLRHTYITELCAAGVDIKKVQYLAGHEDVGMTLRVYAHVVGNSPAELTHSVNKAFSGSNWGSSDSASL